MATGVSRRCSAAVALLMLVGCATSETATDVYTARAQEPGWLLTVGRETIRYSGDYGNTQIVERLVAETRTKAGRRLEGERVRADVVHGRCNDVMSGVGFSDTVVLIADGKRLQGCGGARRPEWDM